MYAYMIYYILGFVMLPGIAFGIYAQLKVSSTFNEYNSIITKRGKTAKPEAARQEPPAKQFYPPGPECGQPLPPQENPADTCRYRIWEGSCWDKLW